MGKKELLEYIEKIQDEKDAMNRRIVTMKGLLPARDVLSGVGPINVHQPRVRDGCEEASFLVPFCPSIRERQKVSKQ